MKSRLTSLLELPGNPCRPHPVSAGVADEEVRLRGFWHSVSLSAPVDPDLAGETVMLWWGIFDNELYIEHGDKRFGPYSPIGGPIPLHRYRAFKKTSTQQRADRFEALAEQLALPRAALEGNPHAALLIRNIEVPVIMFTDPDPFQEFAFPNVLAAKRAIADYLAIPLAKLAPEKLDWINTLVSNTLNKRTSSSRCKNTLVTQKGKNCLGAQ
jgi:hypothetical protein